MNDTAMVSKPGRTVLQASEKSARGHNSSILSTADVLGGLIETIKEGDLVYETFASFDISLETLKDEIRRKVSHGKVSAAGKIKYPQTVKFALEKAHGEAGENSWDLYGPEHILLGLITPQRNVSQAYEILSGHGLTLDAVRERIAKIKSEHPLETFGLVDQHDTTNPVNAQDHLLNDLHVLLDDLKKYREAPREKKNQANRKRLVRKVVEDLLNTY